MECKNCGTPCPDEAVYCGKCGNRLDGKKPCSACGKLVDGQSTYCIYCGNRLDGKNVCKKCGEAYEGQFCPACGTGVALPKKKTTAVSGVKTDKAKRISSLITSGVAMLGVLFAFIFVFLIGVKTGVPGVVGESETLFYYFGDFYKEFNATDFAELATADFTPWYIQYLEKEALAIGIYGTVISALSLLCVCAFAVVAITVYVRGLLGFTQKKAGGWAVATALSYIVGATAFVSLHNIRVQSSLQTGSQLDVSELSNAITYNGATKAGIVLCAIFIGAYFACRFFERILEKGRGVFTKKFALATALSVVGVAFVSVVFSVVKNAGFTINVTEGKTTVETFMSFPLANVEILSMFGSLGKNVAQYAQISQEVNTACIWNTVAEITQLVTLVCVGIALGANLRSFAGKKQGWATVSSVLSLACSVTLLVASASAWNCVETAFAYAESTSSSVIETSLVRPICAVVFSVLLLVVSVICGCVKKRKATEE